MTTVGVRELESHLAEWLRSVRAGNTAVVTDRGRAIAEIRPMPEGGDNVVQRRMTARARGWIGPGEGALPTPSPVAYRGPTLAGAVSQDRDERG
jgi:antitoxin (DNA-binding transcriptional repressor) of toxin-antitoxin stability system